MCGVAINIISLAHHLKKVDFDGIIDHLVLTPNKVKENQPQLE